jgi:tetratricopeptide (TPR) repeat protein
MACARLSRHLTRCLLGGMVLLLSACASTVTRAPAATGLLHDRLFAAPSVRVDAKEVLALSPAMHKYLDQQVRPQARSKGMLRALVDQLYTKEALRLDYDAVMTRNAREAFEARAGNCLSLVVMTAALANELGLDVRFQTVAIDEAWERSGDLHFFIGHVNMMLGPRPLSGWGWSGVEWLTIDFLPNHRRTHNITISQERVLAMYMNNKAAESLATNRLDDAYAWARAAALQDDQFMASFNTLGVIYQRRGALAEAEQALRHVLKVERENVHAMGNLVLVLKRQGREDDATVLAAELRRLQPVAPFAYFKEGLQALDARDYRRARQLFEREISRAADYHEFHFWLAVALVNLGETDNARKHLEQALENSTTREQSALYAGKLQRLKALSRREAPAAPSTPWLQ